VPQLAINFIELMPQFDQTGLLYATQLYVYKRQHINGQIPKTIYQKWTLLKDGESKKKKNLNKMKKLIEE
jgi:hypothetical protein